MEGPSVLGRGWGKGRGPWQGGRQPQRHRDRESKAHGNEHLSSPVLWAQVLARNVGVQHEGGPGMQVPARSQSCKCCTEHAGRTPIPEPSCSLKSTGMFLLCRGCLAEGQSSRFWGAPPVGASALRAEPDGGIQLCRSGSRCQDGSGGARGLPETLFRAGWALVGTPMFHRTRKARQGGRWAALALRGCRRL